MTSTVPNGTSGCQANTVRLDLFAEVMERLPLAIRRCIDALGLKHEWVASEMDISKSYLSEVLSGVKPITIVFLATLPREVRTRLLQALCPYHGLVAYSMDDSDVARKRALDTISRAVLENLGPSSTPDTEITL